MIGDSSLPKGSASNRQQHDEGNNDNFTQKEFGEGGNQSLNNSNWLSRPV